jgi:hypothetical protein
MPERIYHFIRTENGCCVQVQEGDSLRMLTPERSLKVWDHSPTGFEWGYAGSGPAQTALAILLDLGLSDEEAAHLHQEFKFKVITTLNHDKPRQSLKEGYLRGMIDIMRLPTKGDYLG